MIEAADEGTDTIFSYVSSYTLGANLENPTNAGIAGDVNGDGLADFSLSLIGTHPLTTADFVL